MKFLLTASAFLSLLSPFAVAADEAPTKPAPDTARPSEPPPSPVADPTVGGFGPKPPVFNAGPQVKIDVLMIALSEERWLPLLPELRDPAKIEAAQAKLLQMVTAKQARIL